MVSEAFLYSLSKQGSSLLFMRDNGGTNTKVKGGKSMFFFKKKLLNIVISKILNRACRSLLKIRHDGQHKILNFLVRKKLLRYLLL